MRGNILAGVPHEKQVLSPGGQIGDGEKKRCGHTCGWDQPADILCARKDLRQFNRPIHSGWKQSKPAITCMRLME